MIVNKKVEEKKKRINTKNKKIKIKHKTNLINRFQCPFPHSLQIITSSPWRWGVIL